MFLTRNIQTATLLALATVSAACTTDDGLGDLDARESEVIEAEEERSGSVLVEFDPAASEGVSVHAQFLAVRGVSTDLALQALDVWSPDLELDVDSCSVRPPTLATDENVRLHLLDVGTISVAAFDHAIQLDGRRVPDLRTVSGVVYGNEEGFEIDEAFLPFEPQARYQIAAPGGSDAGGFNISLVAPSIPEIETVGGVYAVDSDPIALRGDDLDLRWASALEDETTLFLELKGSTGHRLSCRVEDDGAFVVPATILEQLGSGQLDLALRRIDSVELAIDGVEEGAFVFASTSKTSLLP